MDKEGIIIIGGVMLISIALLLAGNSIKQKERELYKHYAEAEKVCELNSCCKHCEKAGLEYFRIKRGWEINCWCLENGEIKQIY